ncbi:85/88 kDa calcium-independent phospholipase A2-like [Asterias rubens]|uniref:85/88 kDa calcium-independent phospholipase A2-like n=1 Tax=Asterias rubens TaxID=7604 RepID=UPI00145580A7|nr:85/88 kDa calcium-independent phospholipase A2-like [Asterias rubens]
MALFKDLNKMVSSVLSNIQTINPSARTVRKVEHPVQKYSNWPIVSNLEYLRLLNDVKGKMYECVLFLDQNNLFAFSVFRLPVGDATISEFSKLYQTLAPFCNHCSQYLTVEILQKLINGSRSNPTWSSAHIAVQAKFDKCLSSKQVIEHINSQECDAKRTPLHLAVKWNDVSMAKALVIYGAKLNIADAEGESVFHYAARLVGNVSPMLEVLTEDTSDINRYNLRGMTAVQVACKLGNLDTAAGLANLGALVSVTDVMGHPIHYAFKYQNLNAAVAFMKAPDAQLCSSTCVKYGGTALHYAKSAKFVDLAIKHGKLDVNAESKTGHTPLHVMIQRQRLECAMAILCAGANVNVRVPGGDTPLHDAVRKNNLDMVHALIVFGADVNAVNMKKESPRHIATTPIISSLGSYMGSTNHIISALHLVGAKRCPPGMQGCSAGCKAGGTYNGNPTTANTDFTQLESNKAYDEFLAICIGLMASKQGVSMATDETDNASSCRQSDNVLCLDGGGIRGLVLIQILNAIEEAAGRPIADLFDWIAGTSTGGILALALAVGFSVKETRGLYFGLKNSVFFGNRPYPSEPLETFLKQLFGEDTKMDTIVKHKVLVTATLGDRTPPPLHMFRSYEPPKCSSSAALVYNKDTFESPPLFHEQLIWKAARCSGAAPTYFQPMGRFLDGGLIANNPTLDALTELQEYNMDKKMKGEPTRDVGVVVSVGTGCVPCKPMKSTEMARPSSMLDLFNAAKAIAGAANLGEILLDQLTDARGRTLDRARSWCNMIGAPFYRFSTPMSADIPLDETKDSVLLKMLWETEVYLHQNRDKITQLGELLKSQLQ